ncbi:MAG: hypothetical protein AB7S68_30580 [Polyangiaceae bacterium]
MSYWIEGDEVFFASRSVASGVRGGVHQYSTGNLKSVTHHYGLTGWGSNCVSVDSKYVYWVDAQQVLLRAPRRRSAAGSPGAKQPTRSE